MLAATGTACRERAPPKDSLEPTLADTAASTEDGDCNQQQQQQQQQRRGPCAMPQTTHVREQLPQGEYDIDAVGVAGTKPLGAPTWAHTPGDTRGECLSEAPTGTPQQGSVVSSDDEEDGITPALSAAAGSAGSSAAGSEVTTPAEEPSHHTQRHQYEHHLDPAVAEDIDSLLDAAADADDSTTPPAVADLAAAIAAQSATRVTDSLLAPGAATDIHLQHAAEAALRTAARRGTLWLAKALVAGDVDVNADGLEQAVVADGCEWCGGVKEADAPPPFRPGARLVEPPSHECCAARAQADGVYCSPLIWAARHGHLEVVQHLTGHGADLRRITRCLRGNGVYYHDRAFVAAADRGHLDVVRYLARFGCGADESTPPHSSWRKGLAESVHGDADTALTRAAYNGHAPVVRYLLSNHAEDITGRERDAALRIAQHRKHSDVAVLLDGSAARGDSGVFGHPARKAGGFSTRMAGASPLRAPPAAPRGHMVSASPPRALPKGVPSAARDAQHGGGPLRRVSSSPYRAANAADPPRRGVPESRPSAARQLPHSHPHHPSQEHPPPHSPNRGAMRQRSFTRMSTGTGVKRATGARLASKSQPMDILPRGDTAAAAAALAAAHQLAAQSTAHKRSVSAAANPRRSSVVVAVPPPQMAKIERRVSASPLHRPTPAAEGGSKAVASRTQPVPRASLAARASANAAAANARRRMSSPMQAAAAAAAAGNVHRQNSFAQQPPQPAGAGRVVRGKPTATREGARVARNGQTTAVRRSASALRRNDGGARKLTAVGKRREGGGVDFQLRTLRAKDKQRRAAEEAQDCEDYHRRHWEEVTCPRIQRWASECTRPIEWSVRSNTHSRPTNSDALSVDTATHLEQSALRQVLLREIEHFELLLTLPYTEIKQAVRAHRFGCGCLLCVLQSDLSDQAHTLYLIRQELRRDEDLLSFLGAGGELATPPARPLTHVDPAPPMRVHTANHTPPRMCRSLTPPSAERMEHPVPCAPPAAEVKRPNTTGLQRLV